jgi:hypothetical protein
MPIEISYSLLAEQQKRELSGKYPAIIRHLEKLEEAIKTDPLAGTAELYATLGKDLPARSLSARPHIFSGNIVYERELTVVYICSGDLHAARIIQILY